MLAHDYFSNLGASFRPLAGGGVGGYTKLLIDSWHLWESIWCVLRDPEPPDKGHSPQYGDSVANI